MFGFWNVNKTAGVTSRWVVNQAEQACQGVKLGHAGTLDPLATGVLVLAVGPATRLIPYVQQAPKCYRAVFQFGCTSASDDLETERTPVGIPAHLTTERIREALPSFTGTIQQRPPAYSAVKQQGKRAYQLARRGQSVRLAAKSVTIYELDLLAWQLPHLQLQIKCGSGTYIRSLGRDLAAALGTAAVMTQLTRWQVGAFRLENTITVDQLQADPVETLISPLRALDALPRLGLSPHDAQELSHGRPVPYARAAPLQPIELAGTDHAGQLRAILRADPDGRCWPVRNFFFGPRRGE